jgi:hypothetical protein
MPGGKPEAIVAKTGNHTGKGKTRNSRRQRKEKKG